MSRGVLAPVIVCLLAGCAQQDQGESASARAAGLPGGSELLVTPVDEQPPAGSGAPGLVRASWREGSRLRPIALEGPFLQALAFGGGAVVVDRRHELWFVEPGGQRERWGRELRSRPAVSEGGELLAYVEGEAGAGELRLRGLVGGPRLLARGLASAGGLRFSPDGSALLFVGPSEGGVAGLHVVDVDAVSQSPRCLTNCELRVGQRWGEAFLPPPRRPEDLEFEGDRVSWVVDGVRLSTGLRGAP